MAFFTVNTTEENVKDYTGDGGKWLNKSGIYDVIIKAVIVDSTAKGSEFLNLWVEHEGQEQPIYQAMRLTNNDGSPNLGQKLFTKLCVVVGATDGGEISDPVSRMIPMGKDREDFDNTPVTIRLQMEYSMYEGKIQETKSIRNFFRYEDKATASEIVNNSEEKGKQFAAEQEAADKVTYRDGLTEEDVKNYIQNQRNAKNENKDKTPSVGFGQKRSFSKTS